MSQQNVLVSTSANLVTILTTPAGLPAIGILFSDVACSFVKEGDAAPSSKTLTALNFIEIGQGVYRIGFTATDLSVAGSFTWVVSGAAISTFSDVANVVINSNAVTPVSIPTCAISGHVFDMEGNPVAGASVSARILGLPTILSDAAITTDLITAVTDLTGAFVISLPRLAEVDIFIPLTNYRRTLNVPNSVSADLYSIP